MKVRVGVRVRVRIRVRVSAPHAVRLGGRRCRVEHEPRQKAAAQHVGRDARHEATQRARLVEA